MKLRVNATAAAILAASLVVAYAQTSGTAPQAKKHTTTKKEKMPPPPSVEEQINALRQEMQSQIDQLKSSLADKDAQLRQAQQTAIDAQAAAAKAESDATMQQQANTENTAAVSTLQNTVKDLTANETSLATTVSDQNVSLKKAIESPEALRYKGITISPAGSFLAAETAWRNVFTASDINTAFSKIPLQHSANAQMTEFYGSGRQSRLALKATGKLDNMTMTGYYEMDFLSAGVTSNANQSNSYTMRMRQLWADAKLKSGWDFSGGQGWSLVSETTQGLTRGTEITPATIDAAYTPGFVWARQYSFRVTKDFGKSFFAGLSVENPEMLDPSCVAGAGGACPTNSWSSTIGQTSGLYSNQNDYTPNITPDFILKIAAEPGWGHWELFSVNRLFRNRIYPTTGTPYNGDVQLGTGVGGGFRGPLFQKKLVVGLKGLYGQGVGRYGDTTIADVTYRPDGSLLPLHGFSGLGTVDINPTNRMNLYFNYGGDYIGRTWRLNTAGYEIGYGVPKVSMTGCNAVDAQPGTTGTSTPTTPSSCGNSTKDAQAFVAGYWYNIYAGPKGRLRQGFQYSWVRRDIWSGTGGSANVDGGANGQTNMFFTSFRYYLP